MINRNRSAKQKGFSLIEIGFVLVIIAGLSIVLIPKGAALLAKSKNETAYQEVIALVFGVKQFVADHPDAVTTDIQYADLSAAGYVPVDTRNIYGQIIVTSRSSLSTNPKISYGVPVNACDGLKSRLDVGDVSQFIANVEPDECTGTGNIPLKIEVQR